MFAFHSYSARTLESAYMAHCMLCATSGEKPLSFLRWLLTH